jgi:ABC-2 type transport system ATP-binding protein
VSGEPIALEARGLTKRYRDVAALSECSFQLPAHRIIALVGANGAGKSTLMSIAAGLLSATSGEILAAGRRVDARRKTRPAGTAHRVAIPAQDKPLYREFTVAQPSAERAHRIVGREIQPLAAKTLPKPVLDGRLPG